MSIQLQPPLPLVTMVKTEPPTAIKNEFPEEALEEISTDMKDMDIVYHPLCEDLIKSETIFEDILENKQLESVQTQVLVKAENSPFIKTENITQRNKCEAEDSSHGNVSRGTGQGVVEVQASNEDSNAFSKLETDEQSVLNFSKNLNGINVRSRKSKSPKKTDFAECYKTDDTTLWAKEREKIKVVMKAPVIPVEAHEYTSLAKDKHVCNLCQQTYENLDSLKNHIRKKHRKVTTMCQCPYCPYKSKYKHDILKHIIVKHKDTKDIQWFQCNVCEKKFKLKYDLTKHKKCHLTPELKSYHCDTCNYKTNYHANLKRHNKFVHLKSEEYFYCYRCSYKFKRKDDLKIHILGHNFKNSKQEKRHHCDSCDYKTYRIRDLNSHKLIHIKPVAVPYFNHSINHRTY